jgi:hypothetical protein
MNKSKSLLKVMAGMPCWILLRAAFGLLNSVTEFVDHERRSKSTDHWLESAWFGNGAAIKQ